MSNAILEQNEILRALESTTREALTIKETAAVLGVAPITVRRRIAAGIIQTVRTNGGDGVYLIPVVNIRKFLGLTPKSEELVQKEEGR